MNTNATQRTDPTREAVLGAARAIQHVTATEGENALVGEWNRFQAALDAYGQAREMRGHYGVCVRVDHDRHRDKDGSRHWPKCGDVPCDSAPTWLCDQAKAIMEEAK